MLPRGPTNTWDRAQAQLKVRHDPGGSMQPATHAADNSNVNVAGVQWTPVPARWNPATKIAFRFAFVYFLLYNLFIPLHLLPFPPFSQIYRLYSWLSSIAVRWVSVHVLFLKHNFATDYLNTSAQSKDTTFDYVQALCFLIIAVLATVIWSLLDRRRQNYQWLHKWFMVYLRLSLAAAMIPYGAAKIVPAQFPAPTLSRMFDTYGNSSPASLLWTFMGASRSYSIFGGAAELIGGLLLVVPRLATLGALISAAVMANVLMLNVGYDVAVKLGSIHLVLMALIIVLPDGLQLVDFFVRHRTARLTPIPPLVRKIWLNRAFVVLQIAFGFVLLVHDLQQWHHMAAQIEADKNTALFGIWSVDDFNFDMHPAPPLLSDTLRWQRFIVETTDGAAIQGMTGSLQYVYFHPNPGGKSFTLTRYGDPDWVAEFTYDNAGPDHLVLTGTLNGRAASIRLHKEDESKFPLKSNGFRWVQDAQ